MPSTKRQRQRRERAVGEAFAAARLGEAARAHPDASLFFMDDAATETASKRARRAAKKKVATASPTESALLRKFEQRRKARPGHAGARAPKAAAATAPPMEDLWGDAADAGAPACPGRALRRCSNLRSSADSVGDAVANFFLAARRARFDAVSVAASSMKKRLASGCARAASPSRAAATASPTARSRRWRWRLVDGILCES